jgi:DNA modification methylase
LNIENWPVDKPIPYARNARKLSAQAVEKVAASLREYGFRQPIVVDKAGTVICGHTRLQAARKLGLAEVPVHVAENLTPAQVRAYRLMDNRSHQESEWDLELLGPEMSELRDSCFDLRLTGFDTREIDELLLGDDPDAQDDVVPDLPENPITKPGDLWLLGPHRVLCADSTDENAVSRLCGPTRPNLMTTDPPYGVSYDPAWRLEVDGGGRHAVGKVANDDRVDWSPALRLFSGDVAYVWHAGIHAGEVAASLHTIGFQIRAQIIWAKQHFAMSRGSYHWQHEPCWYAVRKGKKSNWKGDRTQSTVWDVKNLNPHGGNKEEQQTGHGTQKPLELMRRPILNHTERGEVVYDPFLGSGSTLIAAEQTERVCFGVDIDTRYVDVTVLRWQQQTGKQATLDGDGRSFEEITRERMNGRAGAV